MLKFLIEKEFKLIRRNSFLPKMIVIMPIVMMCILPFAANMEVKDIHLAVVDNDRSTLSAELSRKITSSVYFIASDYTSSYDQAFGNMESGLIDIIVEIPPHFARDLVNGATPEIHISANAVNAIKASMGSGYLTSITSEFAFAHTPEQTPPKVTVSTQNRFNAGLNYQFFMVPALMVMLLTIVCGSLPAFNIVSEKEHGTIEQMNVTPVGKFAFIFAKLVPYWVIGFVVLTLCFGVAYVVYDLVATGSYFSIYLAALLFILTVSGLGLVVSNYSSTLQQAMFLMFFFLIVMILLSGLFTPVESMPTWAQNITIFNPLKYFIQVMRGVYLKASTLADIWVQLVVLAIFTVVVNTWAVISYHKRG